MVLHARCGAAGYSGETESELKTYLDPEPAIGARKIPFPFTAVNTSKGSP